MLGFLSKENDSLSHVNKEEIRFVHVDDNLSRDDIKISNTKLAFMFANKLNINKVFLHFGKDTIEYDFKV